MQKSMSEYMKEPCEHCPFRKDVKPFLHPERGADIAFASLNPYNSFSCHKTTKFTDEGEAYTTQKSKECAGFLTLRFNETNKKPEGFIPSNLIYSDCWEMANAYDTKD